MKRAQFISAALLFAGLMVGSCTDAGTPPIRQYSGSPASDAVPGPPVLDQKNGTLGFTGSDIRKGFNPHNPQLGDAIIATFIWRGTTNVITSVHDELTNGTPVGNTYNLVEYTTAGGISMATYVALNVQNFPQGNPSDPNPDQNIILVVIGTLSAPITDGGIMLSAFRGVATTAALTGHASAGGTSSTTTQASTGPITPGDGSLVYSVSFSSPNAAHDPPPGTSNITNLSTGDGTVKIVGQWAVHSGLGTTDPQWTWFHTQPSSWLLTNLALLPNGAPPPPTTGNLTATTSTMGSNQDPDGYTVAVDGGAGQAISNNGSVTFSGLSAGDHTVALSGVAANCTVGGSNPRTVTVPSGGTASTAFSIDCHAIPPATGDLSVSASTSGSDLDPDGYTVTVDGGASQAVATNGSVTFTGLSQGNHSVALSGAASNCSVTSANPQTVSVPGGGTANAQFDVDCAPLPPTTGDLNVSASTSGSSLDPNGYTVTLNGGNDRSIGINSSTTYTNLTPGNYSVAISDVASNCTVSGSNPRTVTVTSGGTVSTTFSVTCVTPNTAPVVNAGPDQTVLVSLLFTENWSFTDPDNGPWSYTIDWGDGTFSQGTKTAPGSFSNGHAYGTLLLGKHTIRITVTDSQGASHTDTKVVTVVLF